MTNFNLKAMSCLALLSAGAAYPGEPATTTTEPITFAVRGGSATFVSNTNVPGITVKGKTNALEATVLARRAGDGLALEQIHATLPVSTLATGMALRDDHMRKRVFTTADGQTPDIRFDSTKSSCSISGKTGACRIDGELTIRGVAKPFTLPLKVREDGSGFKATGDAAVKLSAYGIEQPSQLGVKSADEVQLKFDFTAQPASARTARAGAAK
jgi:polyisoprenoid-binding protein YceI